MRVARLVTLLLATALPVTAMAQTAQETAHQTQARPARLPTFSPTR